MSDRALPTVCVLSVVIGLHAKLRFMIAGELDAHTTNQSKVSFSYSKIHKTPLILISLICVEFILVIEDKAHIDVS